MQPSRLVTSFMLIAGQINIIGILVFSKFFTNSHLMELYPSIFSLFGLLMVILWGAAIMAAAWRYYAVPSLLVIFALMKIMYVITWVIWMIGHGKELPTIWQQSPLTAIHFAFYGPYDLTVAIFFALVAASVLHHRPQLIIRTMDGLV